MAIAITLSRYLDNQQIDYELLAHSPTHCSSEILRKTGIPGTKLAKSVVLEDARGYVMAVIPADHKLQIDRISHMLGRKLFLTPEDELPQLFGDCQMGAIPACGAAYGLETVWDDTLAEQPDIYFEAGDHRQLVHMDGAQFQRMMHHQRHGRLCP